jgi:hypothetical protein
MTLIQTPTTVQSPNPSTTEALENSRLTAEAGEKLLPSRMPVEIPAETAGHTERAGLVQVAAGHIAMQQAQEAQPVASSVPPAAN